MSGLSTEKTMAQKKNRPRTLTNEHQQESLIRVLFVGVRGEFSTLGSGCFGFRETKIRFHVGLDPIPKIGVRAQQRSYVLAALTKPLGLV